METGAGKETLVKDGASKHLKTYGP
jgi:hypothetical protein